MQVILFLLIGVLGGAMSGLFGIGGGVIIVPALVYLFKMDQHMAQGTTLALMLPPIGILAAMTYFKHGHLNVLAAVFICAGFVLGAWFGAQYAVSLPTGILRKLFGGLMMLISIHMIFFK
ncbi:MAG: sulfite exporter TauE/SafE family protein [Elusimicrobiota bacterium]